MERSPAIIIAIIIAMVKVIAMSIVCVIVISHVYCLLLLITTLSDEQLCTFILTHVKQIKLDI